MMINPARRLRRPALVAAALCLLLEVACVDASRLVAPALTAPPPATLDVEILTAGSGAPVEGAQILLVMPHQLTARRGAISALTGRAQLAALDSLPAGRYDLVIRRIGYTQQRLPLTLPLRQGASVALRVPLAHTPVCTMGVIRVSRER